MARRTAASARVGYSARHGLRATSATCDRAPVQERTPGRRRVARDGYAGSDSTVTLRRSGRARRRTASERDASRRPSHADGWPALGARRAGRRSSSDGVEHRLQVGRRGRDDPQDLGRRGLLLQRLAQLAVAPLQLLEQPGVLDGDDGLVRERLAAARSAVGEADATSSRRTAMTPIASPSRSSGTVSDVRCRRLDSARLSGTQPDGSAQDVWMWIVRRSRIARPRRVHSLASERRRTGSAPDCGAVRVPATTRASPSDAEDDRTLGARTGARALSAIGVEDRCRSVGERGDRPAAPRRSRSAAPAPRSRLGVALLQLLEQPGVLDGDHGLVRERLQRARSAAR